jgi:SH3-like domain-containing protein
MKIAAESNTDHTGSISQIPVQRGPSGLPLPRFVSLKSGKVNVRKGPSSEYPVSWVFQRKGMPVEIVAEFETWRRIRDSQGEEGWILQQMLAGKRTAIVMGYNNVTGIPLRDDRSSKSAVVATLSPGVVGEVEACDGDWCEISAGGYQGYVSQVAVWGVYPGEVVD